MPPILHHCFSSGSIVIRNSCSDSKSEGMCKWNRLKIVSCNRYPLNLNARLMVFKIILSEEFSECKMRGENLAGLSPLIIPTLSFSRFQQMPAKFLLIVMNCIYHASM